MIYTLIAIMLGMLAYERWRPARIFPRVPFWTLSSILIIGIQIAVVEIGSFLWDRWFERRSLLQLASLGSVWGTIFGFTAISFVSYWQHRLKHRYNYLWRFFHQVHHAPSRVEIFTSFYRNPFEILINMFLMSFILFFLLGSDAIIARNVVFLMGAADLFYHWNIRTPVWLGYFIQRPEAHCIHHLTGVHAYNYGDIPLWDVLFGTYRNVESFNGTCGFGRDNERRFFSMLAGKDLSGKRIRQ
jgi:sterol desaturase/sphingolipid hydroxylase (fatty acid hydroxylase superfamily)